MLFFFIVIIKSHTTNLARNKCESTRSKNWYSRFLPAPASWLLGWQSRRLLADGRVWGSPRPAPLWSCFCWSLGTKSGSFGLLPGHFFLHLWIGTETWSFSQWSFYFKKIKKFPFPVAPAMWCGASWWIVYLLLGSWVLGPALSTAFWTSRDHKLENLEVKCVISQLPLRWLWLPLVQ